MVGGTVASGVCVSSSTQRDKKRAARMRLVFTRVCFVLFCSFLFLFLTGAGGKGREVK